MRNSIILSLLFILIIAPNARAMDKRAPVSILPYKQQSIKFVYSKMYNKSKQYRQNGALLSSAESSVFGSKLIYRNTFMKDVELGVEIPYLFSKDGESKSVSGSVNKIELDDGIGDADVQLTYQIKDFRTENYGAIFGAEIKFPTGDAEQSKGTNAYELVYRAALTKKIKNFMPFIQAIYTDKYTGKVNGINTNMGDDLFMGVGTKVTFKKKARLEFKYFYDFATTGTVRSSGGSRVRYQGYDIRGYRLKGEVFIGEHIILEAFYEAADPLGHEYYMGSNTIYKEPEYRNRLATGITYRW
ncbi:MAG: hypothetical protein C0603_09650 [Denitrovibrio sp.]|nr:MAG: hypothetical protein C0603_09650 [Denitrovibrio sp.]